MKAAKVDENAKVLLRIGKKIMPPILGLLWVKKRKNFSPKRLEYRRFISFRSMRVGRLIFHVPTTFGVKYLLV